jgi:hypothetical protein
MFSKTKIYVVKEVIRAGQVIRATALIRVGEIIRAIALIRAWEVIRAMPVTALIATFLTYHTTNSNYFQIIL